MTRRVEMITHKSDDDCDCPGIYLQEGRGDGAAWLAFDCGHCGEVTPWAKAPPDRNGVKSQFRAALTHSQRCWANARKRPALLV